MLKKVALGFAMTTGLLLGGCAVKTETSKDRATLYMNKKSDVELLEVLKPLDNFQQNSYNYAQVQSKLDSVAYKDVFESTNLAKDSVAVKEFNAIAALAQAPKLGETTVKMKNNLLKTRIGFKIYNEITSQFSDLFFSNGERCGYEYLQYITDSINYRKFFDKHELMDRKTLKKFKEVSKKIRP